MLALKGAVKSLESINIYRKGKLIGRRVDDSTYFIGRSFNQLEFGLRSEIQFSLLRGIFFLSGYPKGGNQRSDKNAKDLSNVHKSGSKMPFYGCKAPCMSKEVEG